MNMTCRQRTPAGRPTFWLPLTLKRQRNGKSELYVGPDDRHDRLRLNVDAIHLDVAEISLKFVSAARDCSTHSVEQHLDSLTSIATGFACGAPDLGGVMRADRSPRLHPTISLI